MERIGSLFTGMLGLDLAVERACPTARLVWACEIAPLPQRAIRAHRPDAHVFGDVRGLDPPPVDILTGGFPCQDISVAGKQAGLGGAKSSLWREMHAVIERICPRRVLIENVRNLRRLGLREVLADLARIGYAAEWQTVQALAAGALHRRSRLFIVAYPDAATAPLLLGDGLRDAYAEAFGRHRSAIWSSMPCSPAASNDEIAPADRAARLTATGNAVCPQQAEPIAQAMLSEGEPWDRRAPHEGLDLPIAGSMRGGCIYARPVAVPEALAMGWHRAWCDAHPDRARAVLPAWPRRGAPPVWPTPCTTDAASAARHTTTAEAMNPGTTLTDAVRLWATPMASDWRSGSVSDAVAALNSRPLREQVSRCYAGQAGIHIRPEWASWLMGFPPGWLGASRRGRQLGLFE